VAKCGPEIFFCGRRRKFGLNMQGTCNSHGHFLDVMEHLAATLDYLAFSSLALKHKLERIGFLAPGLYLVFGDNMYVNTSYIDMPTNEQLVALKRTIISTKVRSELCSGRTKAFC
jgi:hypothetical protein